MATYTELYDLRNNSALKNKVLIACLIAADAIRSELDTVANHANRLVWAKSVFMSPDSEADRMMLALIAQNQAAAVGAITGAADTAILTAVNNAVNVFATSPA